MTPSCPGGGGGCGGRAAHPSSVSEGCWMIVGDCSEKKEDILILKGGGSSNLRLCTVCSSRGTSINIKCCFMAFCAEQQFAGGVRIPE